MPLSEREYGNSMRDVLKARDEARAELKRLREGVAALVAEQPTTDDEGVAVMVPWRGRLRDLLDAANETSAGKPDSVDPKDLPPLEAGVVGCLSGTFKGGPMDALEGDET